MCSSDLKAAEKKLDVASSGERADDSRAVASPQSAPRKEEADANRLKPIVTMYESMKPKDAAKIFDRLDIRVLLELASQINPRKMSEILAQMNPEAAERLTVELASRGAPGDRTVNPANLPKIDGRPSDRKSTRLNSSH